MAQHLAYQMVIVIAYVLLRMCRAFCNPSTFDGLRTARRLAEVAVRAPILGAAASCAMARVGWEPVVRARSTSSRTRQERSLVDA